MNSNVDDGLNRHLGAILAADAAGYSRLMALDDRATVTALDAARSIFMQAVEHRGGRVVDMAGDSVLAIFDTARGAVEAALAAQKRIEADASAEPEERRLRFRIGIHLGDVIEKTDGSVYGDGVNIAARLQAIAEPGGITVSDAVRGAVGLRLTVQYDDIGEQQIKNIAMPVRAFRLVAPATVEAGMRRWFSRRRLSLRHSGVRSLIATAAAVLVGAGFYLQPWRTPAPDAPALSAIVLPFSATPDTDSAIADSLSDGLAAELGRMRMANVFASGSAVTNPAALAGAIAANDAVRVRYAIGGELRVVGGQVELFVRLVDAASASLRWSERFEVPQPISRSQLAWLQARLANHVSKALYNAALDRAAKQMTWTTAEDLLLKGDLAISAGNDLLAAVRDARLWYDKALRVNPNYGPAIVARGWTLDWEFQWDPKADRTGLLTEMEQLSVKAVALDPRDDSAWAYRSVVLGWQGRWGEALAANEKARLLAPYRPNHVTLQAVLMLLNGRQSDAEVLELRAIAMDPPGSAAEFRHLCFSRLLMGRYDDALPDCERSAALDQWIEDQMLLTALYGLKGDQGKASIARDKLMAALPWLTVDNSWWAKLSTVPAFREQLEAHAHRGLRLAGVPER